LLTVPLAAPPLRAVYGWKGSLVHAAAASAYLLEHVAAVLNLHEYNRLVRRGMTVLFVLSVSMLYYWHEDSCCWITTVTFVLVFEAHLYVAIAGALTSQQAQGIVIMQKAVHRAGAAAATTAEPGAGNAGDGQLGSNTEQQQQQQRKHWHYKAIELRCVLLLLRQQLQLYCQPAMPMKLGRASDRIKLKAFPVAAAAAARHPDNQKGSLDGVLRGLEDLNKLWQHCLTAGLTHSDTDAGCFSDTVAATAEARQNMMRSKQQQQQHVPDAAHDAAAGQLQVHQQQQATAEAAALNKAAADLKAAKAADAGTSAAELLNEELINSPDLVALLHAVQQQLLQLLETVIPAVCVPVVAAPSVTVVDAADAAVPCASHPGIAGAALVVAGGSPAADKATSAAVPECRTSKRARSMSTTAAAVAAAAEGKPAVKRQMDFPAVTQAAAATAAEAAAAAAGGVDQPAGVAGGSHAAVYKRPSATCNPGHRLAAGRASGSAAGLGHGHVNLSVKFAKHRKLITEAAVGVLAVHDMDPAAASNAAGVLGLVEGLYCLLNLRFSGAAEVSKFLLVAWGRVVALLRRLTSQCASSSHSCDAGPAQQQHLLHAVDGAAAQLLHDLFGLQLPWRNSLLGRTPLVQLMAAATVGCSTAAAALAAPRPGTQSPSASALAAAAVQAALAAPAKARTAPLAKGAVAAAAAAAAKDNKFLAAATASAVPAAAAVAPKDVSAKSLAALDMYQPRLLADSGLGGVDLLRVWLYASQGAGSAKNTCNGRACSDFPASRAAEGLLSGTTFRRRPHRQWRLQQQQLLEVALAAVEEAACSRAAAADCGVLKRHQMQTAVDEDMAHEQQHPLPLLLGNGHSERATESTSSDLSSQEEESDAESDSSSLTASALAIERRFWGQLTPLLQLLQQQLPPPPSALVAAAAARLTAAAADGDFVVAADGRLVVAAVNNKQHTAVEAAAAEPPQGKDAAAAAELPQGKDDAAAAPGQLAPGEDTDRHQTPPASGAASPGPGPASNAIAVQAATAAASAAGGLMGHSDDETQQDTEMSDLLPDAHADPLGGASAPEDAAGACSMQQQQGRQTYGPAGDGCECFDGDLLCDLHGWLEVDLQRVRQLSTNTSRQVWGELSHHPLTAGFSLNGCTFMGNAGSKA
jgi:hypothetical protein